MINTDGNLAALNAYQREQDHLDDMDIGLEASQGELSDALFEAYYKSNQDVIDEVNDYLEDTEVTRTMLIEACDYIASQYDSPDDIDMVYTAFKL